jgi:hypothetical protein
MEKELSKFFCFCVTLGLILGVFPTSLRTNVPESACLVSGRVLSPVDASILDVTLTFISQDKPANKFSVASDKNGQYQIELLGGKYNVFLTKKFQEELFKGFQRSEIIVDCKNNREINIYPWSEISRPYKDNIVPDFRYDIFKIKEKNLILPKVVISYAIHNKTRGNDIYEIALMTFGVHTVKAKTLSVKKKDRLFTAVNGWIEDGEKRMNFSKLVFSIKSDGLQITELEEEPSK